MKTVAALALSILSSPLLAQSIPVHGNYCGINHSGGPVLFPPTDQLDASCMRHDACTGYQGRFSCGCDISFMQELRATKWPNPGLQAKARAVYDSIGILPCTNANGMAIKAEMIMGDWSRDVLSGRQAPWEILRRWGYLGRGGIAGDY